ncbi:MAG: DMT family transporter [bacterium]
MSRHTVSGKWQVGLGLSLITCLMWGVLPIALKIMLKHMDAVTITWFRLSVSALVLFPILYRKRGVPRYKKLRGKYIVLAGLAIVGLCGNYMIFLFGLNYLTPSGAEVVIQFAPMFLLIGSLVIFKERFHPIQWVGFATFFVGLALFFNQSLAEILGEFSGYAKGILLIMLASFSWSVYALSQKQLLKNLTSPSIMLLIYAGGTVLLLPISAPAQVVELDTVVIFVLLFCAVNTLIAYGSFSEALDHWEASRVSAVITTVPIITVVCMKIGSHYFPEFIEPESLNTLSIIGTFLVVIGSMVTSLGGRRKTVRQSLVVGDQ